MVGLRLTHLPRRTIFIVAVGSEKGDALLVAVPNNDAPLGAEAKSADTGQKLGPGEPLPEGARR